MSSVFGSATIKAGQDIAQFNSDDFVVVNSGEIFQIEKETPDTLLCRVDIPLHVLQESGSASVVYFEANTAKNPTLNYDNVRDTIKMLLLTVSSAQKMTDYRYFELGYRLLDELVENFAVDEAEHEKDGRRIDRITSYMRALYSTRLSLGDVAGHFYMSPAYFSRYFKAETGETFVSYLDGIRLEQALFDIRHADCSITDIASMHGFASVSALNKSFRARYGKTPSAYRKEYRSEHPIQEAERKQRHSLRRLRELDLKPLATSTVEEVRVDISQRQPMRFNPCGVINVGSAHHLMTMSIQQQVLKLKREFRFKTLRICDIFDVRMTHIDNDEVVLNRDNAEQVAQFLFENRLGAFISLDLPHLGRFDLPDLSDEDFESYTTTLCNLLRSFLSLVVNQFLLSKALSLQFELGNSAGLSPERYAILFGEIRSVLDTFSRRFVLGGPCFRPDKTDAAFVAKLAAQDIPFDFISMESYGLSEELKVEELLDNHSLKRDVDHIKECLKGTKYEACPFYVTAWNLSRETNNYLNDTCYKGAYMARSIQSVINDVDILIYGCMSDITEGKRLSYQLLDGLPGLLSCQGIHKPAFFGLKFFHHIHEYVLESTPKYLVTADVENNVALVCNNCCPIDPAIYARREGLRLNDIDKLFKQRKTRYRFRVSGVAQGTYQVRSFIVNRDNASLLDMWREWGFISSLAVGDIDHLLTSLMPTLHISEVTVTDGVLVLEIDMEPNQISMMRCDHIAL